MQKPRYGFGQMHYTSLSRDAVKSAYESSSAEFKLKYALDIPRRAFDVTESGKSVKMVEVGCYWVVSERV